MSSDFISENPVSTARSIGQPGNCHNRLGKNQYKDRPPPDDPQVTEALKAYHKKGINDSEEISRLLLEEHGVTLCGSSVKRRRQKLGLLSSRGTTLQMSDEDKRRLIVEEMAKDPKGRYGAQVIKQRIFQDTGIHLSRAYVREEMRTIDPASYAKRGPRHTKLRRLERLAHAAPTSSSVSNRPIPKSQTPQRPGSRFIVHVCGSGRPTPYQEPVDDDIESPSENDFPTADSIPFTEPLQFEVSDALSEPPMTLSAAADPQFMANASTLLENAIPAMRALALFLNDASMSNVEIDQRTYELFNRGIESTVMLERQLSHVLSQGRRTE